MRLSRSGGVLPALQGCFEVLSNLTILAIPV